MLSFTLGVKAQPTFGSKPGADSGNVTGRQNSRTWTAHELDSLYKYLRVQFNIQATSVQFDTTGEGPWPHYTAEQLKPLVANGTITFRDSTIRFIDTLCFKWYARIGRRPGRALSIWFKDTCAAASSCVGYIGDVDRIFVNLCDSLRILGYGPQVFVTMANDSGGINSKKALYVKVDTISIPVVFQIYRTRGTPPSSMQDTGAYPTLGGFFTLSSTVGGSSYGFPMHYRTGIVQAVSWTMRNTNNTIIGGKWIRSHTSGMVVSSTKQLLVKWVTNPTSRSLANNKTKIGLYAADITDGGAPQINGNPTNIAWFEIEDDYGGTGYDATQLYVTVVVWLACTL